MRATAVTIDAVVAEWKAEGVSISRLVLLGETEVAARMVCNVFDAQEFNGALRTVAVLEACRLQNKLDALTPNGSGKGDDKA